MPWGHKKCNHCKENCTRAVYVTLGYIDKQDKAFIFSLERSHGQGIAFSALIHKFGKGKEINFNRENAFEKAKIIYEKLKIKKKLGVQTTEHSFLLWGIYANSYEGMIINPQTFCSDPRQEKSVQKGVTFFQICE